MTDIEKKAEEYVNAEGFDSTWSDIEYYRANEVIEQAYKDGYKEGLYDKHADREDDILHLSKENAELKAKIEKMMSCTNCKFFDGDNYCPKLKKIIHRLNGSCSVWEIAE